MKRRLVWGISLAVAGTGGSLLVLSRREAATAKTRDDWSTTSEALRTGAELEPAPEVEMAGVLFCREAVDVAAKIDGRIDSVRVRLGEAVARDALIATLDAQLQRKDLAIAEATLRASYAERDKAALDVAQAQKRAERRAMLSDQRLIASEELETAEFDEKVAAARLATARAQAAEKEAQLERIRQTVKEAEIRAPIAGRVAARYLDPGAVVAPKTPIVRLVGSDDLWVRFAVPANRTRMLQVGQKIRVRLPTLGLELAARVEHLSPEIDAVTGMALAEAKLLSSEPTERLVAGLAARVLLGERDER
jgi:RND family efflux transporter MFP subunit